MASQIACRGPATGAAHVMGTAIAKLTPPSQKENFVGRRAIIREGDTTSHGGKVLEGHAFYTIDGKPAAGVGHMVFCPLCKGNFPISGDLLGRLYPHRVMDRDTAVEGMRTTCGAILIASQSTDTIEDTGKSDEHDVAHAGSTGAPSPSSALCIECLQEAAESGAATVVRE